MKRLSMLIVFILVSVLLTQTARAGWRDYFKPRKKASPAEQIRTDLLYPKAVAPQVGDEFSATGKVIRVLTWSYNTTTPCMAVIKRDSDGMAFEAFARAFDNEGLKKYAASALCDTLINAFESQKTVVVAGEIEELGLTGSGGTPFELGNLKVKSLNYFEGAVTWEDTPTADALRNSELLGGIDEPLPPCEVGDECSGHGAVTRILNWPDNSTTLCMAILKTADDEIIKTFVRQPTNYGDLSDISKEMVAHSMLKTCHTLSEALSAQKTVYLGGTLEAGGALKTNSANILQVEGQWGSELPSAF